MNSEPNEKPNSNIKWKTIVGLVLLVIATLMNWTWVYGVLFIVWAINDIITGVTHFVEAIYVKENPIMFWIIIVLWIAPSSYWFIEPLYRVAS